MMKTSQIIFNAKAPKSLESAKAYILCFERPKNQLLNKTLFHPNADGLKRLIFQLQIFSYEFMAPGPIVYVDESGLALDTPRDRGCARRVKIGNCHWSHNGLQTIECWPI